MKKVSLYILLSLIFATTIAVWYSAQKVTPGKSFDTIIVGTNTERAPFSFKENDTIVGFDIDVISEAVKRLNKKIIVKDILFNALITEVQLGNIYVIAAGITPNPDDVKRALFTQPHFISNSPDINNSAFGISRHYPELRDYIQIILDRMKDDGTLDALKKKWNLS